nr:MAG TPA: hypothetical protein [Caudoviricetes sp.]
MRCEIRVRTASITTKRTELVSQKNVPLAAAEKCLGLIGCFVLHAKRTEVSSDKDD